MRGRRMSTKLRILIVDEEEESRSFMEQAFEGSAHQFDAVSCPKEAMALLEKETYDLMIDIQKNRNLGYLIEQIKHYLNMIKSKRA